MARKVIQKDIKIYYVSKGRKYELPYAFNDFHPRFCWDLPEGITQKSFVFEIRTMYPVLFSDGVTYQCAYHNSSKIQDEQSSDIVSIKPEYSIINTLDENTWKGVCEVRLSIYASDGNVYCTHEETSETYDFEMGIPQYKKWGSKRDGLYFVFDESINTISNAFSATLQFSKAIDENPGQQLVYDFQISRTPLFGEGVSENVISFNSLSMGELQQYYSIPIAFQNERNSENWVEETQNTLYPNTMYFMRARAFDGLDYGDWSNANAFICILNSIPVCHIASVEYPLLQQDENANSEDEYDRPNGELKIKCYVTDLDNKSVSVGFAYSMVVNESEALDLDVLPTNAPLTGLEGNHEDRRLIRASIVESLIAFPTSKTNENIVELTWITGRDIQNALKENVCLYMYCHDGTSFGIADKMVGITIDNIGIGADIGGTSMQAQQIWLKGSMQNHFAYAVLPRDMLEQVLAHGNEPGDGSKKSMRSWKDGKYKNWYDFWKNAENGSVGGIRASYGLDKITFNSDWSLTHWDKYPTITYTNGVSDIGGPNKIEIIGIDENTGKIVHKFITRNDSSTTNATTEHFQVTYGTGSSSYVVDYDEMTNYNGSHTIRVIYKDNEQTEVLNEGFVSFCPKCERLYPLTTVKQGNDLSFRCPNCGTTYPMDLRYHQALAYGIWFNYAGNIYAYYNGYNSTIGTSGITKQLELMTQSEYDLLKVEWEESNSSDFPYEFAQIKKWYKNKENPEEGQIVKDNERFGFMPPDVLLNMNPRPEIDGFTRVVARRAEALQQAVYLDGMQLNASVKEDYAKDFDKKEKGDGGLTGDDFEEPDSPEVAADKDAVKKLSQQKPWSLFNKVAYVYAEGKKQIAQEKSYKEGGSAGSDENSEDNENEENDSAESEEGRIQTIEPEINVVFDAESPSVASVAKSINGQVITYIYNRMTHSGITDFSILVERNVNDRYCYCINDGDMVSGSILPNGVDTLAISYPVSIGDSDYNNWEFVMRKVFPQSVFNLIVTGRGNNAIHFCLYGLETPQLKSYCLLDCDSNCYDALGVRTFETYQSYQKFPGAINGENTSYIRNGSLGGEGESANHQYYFTSVTRAKHKIHAEESPIDNEIEEKYNQAGGASKGEPMFTCNKDVVDENGYHFRYSEEEYAKTHKIYIRKYHLETCNPFPHPIFGYRNWDVFPIAGEEGKYVRKRVLNGRRGSAPEARMIDVVLSNGEMTREIGLFKPGVEDLPNGKVRGDCISHDKMEMSNSESQIPEEEIPFIRKENYAWRNKIIPKECVVFEYVDIEEALKKNPIDCDNGFAPLNHKAPFGISLSYKQLFKRYGKYVMGAYEVSTDQLELDSETRTVWGESEFGERQLKLEENTYQKRFTEKMRVVDENNRVVEKEIEFYEEMPNNYREAIPGIKLVTESERDSTITTHIIQKKKNKPNTASIKTYDRYKKNWVEKNQLPYDEQNDGVLSQITVEPWNPSFYTRVGIYEKWGYEPMHKIGKYWSVDEDGVYGGKYIPLDSTTVHAIYKNSEYDKPGDPFGDYRVLNNYIAERSIVSDKTFRKTDETYDKLPWLDYRLTSENNTEIKNYFSGYPGSEHKWFEGRPEPAYPFDRQGRVTIKFDEMKQYGRWGFIYLQDKWNNYNRVHWVATQDRNTYAIIKVLDVTPNVDENEEFEREFSLKTLTSVWIDSFNAWCIPYKDNDQSDIIDTKENQFIEGHKYQFELQVANKNSGDISTPVYSITFSISREYVSPATIVETKYDAWTGIISIKFRFDDAMGRRYDVNAVQYTLTDPEDFSENTQDGTWIDIEMGNISGNIQDLASNDGSEVGAYVSTHTLKFPVSCLSLGGPTDSLRIRIVSDVSVNRKGLTLPIFQIKMWANEFLKIAEDNICSLQGCKTRWKWVEETDEDGNTSGKWEYLEADKAITTLGKIQETQWKIDALNEEFENYYVNVAKFGQADLDAYECYVKLVGAWNDWYYGDLFSTYMQSENLFQEYSEYAQESLEENPLMREQTIKENWLYKTARKSVFANWYEENRLELLKQHYVSNGLASSFLSWLPTIAPAVGVQQSIIDFCKLSSANYVNYWESRGVVVTQYESNSGSGSDEQVETIVYTSELCQQYVDSSDEIRENWLNYYSSTNMYADTRYQSRLAIVAQHQDEFNAYVQTHDFSWFANQEAIAMQWFVEEIGAEVENYGKTNSMMRFMQNRDNSGIAYSMKYQSYNEEMQGYYAELQKSINDKQMLETDFRIALVRQGFFCNGFENNKAFNGKKVNTCFRWRVETRPYEGTIVNNVLYDENGNMILPDDQPVNGYQDRYNMYFRTQLDFFDTFDSQGERKPLRDVLFVYDGETDDCRLLAAIKDANNSASTMPDSQLNPESTNTNEKSSSYDPNALQFYGSFALAKNECPGQIVGDNVPSTYARPQGANGFESIYYWRTASYNLVSCPVLGNIQGDLIVRKMGQYNIDGRNYYHYECIVTSKSYHKDIVRSAGNWGLLAGYSRLQTPIWKKDVESIGFSQSARHYNNEWVNKDMLDNGQVCFVTDRPRQYHIDESVSSNSNADVEIDSNSASNTQREIEFIEDNIGNYETLWYPSGLDRIKPCIVRFNKHYLLFAHKQCGVRDYNGSLFVQYQITMSRGFASNVFGEECQCFPRYCNQLPSEIKLKDGQVGNAIGFLNANVVQLPNGVWRMYFNAQKYNEIENEFYTEIWKCDTSDFDSWFDFEKVTCLKNSVVQLNLEQPFVSITTLPNATKYEMLCVAKDGFQGKNVIQSYVCVVPNGSNSESSSEQVSDGIAFEYNETISGVYVGMCDMQSPCLVKIGDNSYRLYATCIPPQNVDENYSIVVSRDRINGVWQENEVGDFKMVLGGEGEYFESLPKNYSNAIYSNAYVYWDTDNFTPVLRMYFNTWDNPYIYDGQELKKDEGIVERTIHTMYLEEYNWRSVYMGENLQVNSAFYNTYGDYINARDAIITPNDNASERAGKCQFIIRGNNVPVCAMSTSADGVNWLVQRLSGDGVWYSSDFPTSFNGMYVRFEFVTDYGVEAIKLSGITPLNNQLRCMAQSKWIDWANVSQTQAILMPEQQEDYDYTIANYTYQGFIEKNGLQSLYADWLASNAGSYNEENEKEMQLCFLIDTHYYSDYLWWSRKGPGIYRYLPVVQQYTWDGSVKKPNPLA